MLNRRCRQLGILEPLFLARKKQYEGLELDQDREYLQLVEENVSLKMLVAELSLNNVVFKDVLQKNIPRSTLMMEVVI